VVEARDLFDNRKAQAATVTAVVGGVLYAVEPLEDESAFFGRNTWPVVLH